MLQGLFGVNWQTTIAGITVIMGIVTKIIAEVHAKDWSAVFSDVPGLLTDLMALAIAIGLIKAKDGSTTGVGAAATKAGS